MNVSKVEFKELKDKGIVIAQIGNIRYDAIDKINRNFVDTVTSKIGVDTHWDRGNEYTMPHSLKAIARCAPNDTYDFEVGKKIALKKLTEKYESGINKRIARFRGHMAQVCSNIDKYFETRNF